ncbi:MAG: hypothetical protein ACWGMZ_00425, partial [Thermoguttaceae bacterium]
PRNKFAVAFGSHGWGKGVMESVEERFREMRWEIICQPIRSKYRPSRAILDQCREAGKMLAEKVLALNCGDLSNKK